MFKDVKFLATTAQPSYKEVSHWIDLLEDPTGGTIKVWNGAGWKKISGEGDSDTGLVIGDTTGTAYDGGKGKELETVMDQISATTNELQDTISSLQTEIENKKIFQFSYLDLQNKTEDFVQRFFDAVSSGTFEPPMDMVFLYRHGRDDLNKYMNLYMTVSNYYFSIGQPIKITFYSTIYHDKDLDRDQFIKLTATISTNNIMDNPTFEIEEVPVDLNSYNVINVSSSEDIMNLNYNQIINIAEQMDSTIPNYILYEGKYLCLADITLYDDDVSLLTIKLPGEQGIVYYFFGSNDANFIKLDFEMPIHESLSMIVDRTIGYAPKKNRWRVILENHTLDVLNNYPIENIINDEETDTGKTISTDELRIVGNLGTYTTIRDVDEMFYVPIISQKEGVQDDTLSITYYAEIPQLLIQKHSLEYRYLDIICRRESTDADTWGVYVKYRKDILTSEFATNDDLETKQDKLVSGTNIKTVNGNSLLGEGNIEIQGGGSGISDAPSDGKKYVRQNANWVEETTVDTSNFATTAQLASKVDTSTYTEDKATFATKAELANKANTSDLSNYLTSTDAESNYAKKGEIPSLEGYLQTSTADEKYATKTELSGKADTSALTSKQDTLVSGTNIKTINNQSLLGNGNIDIAAGDSKVYVFELSKYVNTRSSQRFTGIIDDEDVTALTDAISNDKLILGKIMISTYSAYIPLQIISGSGEVHLKGEFFLGLIYLLIVANIKTYQGYFRSETVEANDSSTVMVSPLPDELIYIQSGTSTLTHIDVDNQYNFRLRITTKDQSVALKIRQLKGLIGSTINEGNITLEANSSYEIDVTDNIAVVAKINLVGPQ